MSTFALSRLTVVLRPQRLQKALGVLEEFDEKILDAAVREVSGSGARTPMGVPLIPKSLLEVYTTAGAAEAVAEALVAAARTGDAGDGKVVITGVEDAVDIRTGARGGL